MDFSYFLETLIKVALDPWLILVCLAMALLSRSLFMTLFLAIIAGSTMNFFVDYFFVDMNFPERSPLYRYFGRVLAACVLTPLLYVLLERLPPAQRWLARLRGRHKTGS